MPPKIRDKSKIAIIITVLLAHLAFLVLPFLSSHAMHKPVKNHLVVKTISPKTSVKKPQASSPKKEVAKASAPAKKEPAPQPKAPEKKATPVKPEPQKAVSKVPPKTTPTKPTPAKAVKKAEPKMKIPTDLLQELEESIAKIDKKGDKIAKKLETAASKSQITLSVDKRELEVDTEEQGQPYEASLIQCLHDHLHLPEYGEVKLRLTLKDDGSVLKVVILKAESEKNKKYLEVHLPLVRFPPVGGLFTKKSEHNFTLTFVNAL